MADATFRSGSPVMADHTPAAAVVAGDFVAVGDVGCIAHVAIAANALGSLAVGGGIYDMVADAAIAAGKLVYWDGTSKVTETLTANGIGFISPGSSSASDGDIVQVVHRPNSA